MNDKLTELLTALSEKLGTTTELVYKTMIKQAKLDFYVSLIQFIIICPLIFILLTGWHHVLPFCIPKNPNGTYSWDREWPTEIQILVALLVVGSLVWAISIVFMACGLIEKWIKNLNNPEGVALENILSILRK